MNGICCCHFGIPSEAGNVPGAICCCNPAERSLNSDRLQQDCVKAAYRINIAVDDYVDNRISFSALMVTF